jgi:hypothetical protein
MGMVARTDPLRIGLAVSGVGHMLSILLFAYNIFRSAKAVAPPQPQKV